MPVEYKVDEQGYADEHDCCIEDGMYDPTCECVGR